MADLSKLLENYLAAVEKYPADAETHHAVLDAALKRARPREPARRGRPPTYGIGDLWEVLLIACETMPNKPLREAAVEYFERQGRPNSENCAKALLAAWPSMQARPGRADEIVLEAFNHKMSRQN